MTQVSLHGTCGYQGDWYGNVRRKCKICKKEFYARGDWAYQLGYKNCRTYYCSYGHMRQAQRDIEAKKAKMRTWAATEQKPNTTQEPKRGGRQRTEFTPELEAEIYRRYKAGQRGLHVARDLGINEHGIYNRYRQWKAEGK